MFDVPAVTRLEQRARMRKVILNLAVSLDGFIEGPNGEYDWCFTDKDYGMTQFLRRVDAVFFGRKSYELVSPMARTLIQNWRGTSSRELSNPQRAQRSSART